MAHGAPRKRDGEGGNLPTLMRCARVQDAPQDGDRDTRQASLCELGVQEVNGATAEQGPGRALWRAQPTPP